MFYNFPFSALTYRMPDSNLEIEVMKDENFLKHNPVLPFKVLTSEKCLRII